MKNLKITVLIKQVPGSSNVEVDPVTGVMKRDGAAGKLNPYDLFALEEALQLRERFGGSVTVLSMGPAQAESSLREALAMGADRAVLLCDRRLVGSDVLATSRALANAVTCCGEADLILAGKQTTDGDTAQVGPEVAEILNIPHVCGVTGFDSVTSAGAELTCSLGRYEYTLAVGLPFLAAVDKDINTPRLPSYRRMKAIAQDAVKRIGIDHFTDHDPAHYGMDGSATSVERMFPPERSETHNLYQENANALADRFYDLLRARKII